MPRGFSSIDKPKKRYLKPFKVEYFYWGHSSRKAADKYGFCWDLAEAYANASRHLGRGSIYYRAIIIDTEQEKPIAILTRGMHQITIKEF